MESYTNNDSVKYLYEDISVKKGNKIAIERAKEAVSRINKTVNWGDDNEEILFILEAYPRFCYFATLKEEIVGYAIVREDGEDRHLHVSWIATDTINRGIGTMIMHKIFNKSKSLGNRILTLHHRKGNIPLKRFYEKIAELEAVKYLCQEVNEREYRVTYEW